MTAAQEARIRRERRLTVVSITLLVVLSLALLYVTVRGDIDSRRERTAAESARAAEVQLILEDVQHLQECVVDLLLIPVEVRIGLPDEDILAVCPPLVAPTVVEATPPDETPTVTPSASRPTIAPAEPPSRGPPAARPPPAPPDRQPAAPPPDAGPPPAPPPAEPPAPPPAEPEQGTVPQLLDDVSDTVCTLTPALC